MIHLNKFNEANKNRDEPTYYYIQDLLVDISDEFKVEIHHDSLRHHKIQTFLIDIYLEFSIQDFKDDTREKEWLRYIDYNMEKSKKLFDCWSLIRQFLLRLDEDAKFEISVIEDDPDHSDGVMDFIRINLSIPKQK